MTMIITGNGCTNCVKGLTSRAAVGTAGTNTLNYS